MDSHSGMVGTRVDTKFREAKLEYYFAKFLRFCATDFRENNQKNNKITGYKRQFQRKFPEIIAIKKKNEVV
jgi:hypothetical protein